MNKPNRNWVGAIFGVIFVLAGLIAAWSIAGRMLFAYIHSTNWVEVPAQIQQLELARNHRSVNVSYTYSYEGRHYRNSTLSINHANNDYWRKLYDDLKRIRSRNQATVFVNPEKPGQAVMDRTFRWESIAFAMIFTVIFCGFGGAVTWVSLYHCDKKQNIQLSSGEGIASQEKNLGRVLFVLGGMIFMVGIAISWLAVPKALSDKNYLSLLVLLFPIVGAGILIAATRASAAYKRFGPTPLFLDPLSPAVGGEFGAWFEIMSAKLTNENTELNGTLSCIRRYRSGRSTRRKILWQSPVPIYSQLSSGGIKAIGISQLPTDCKPTREWSNGHSIEWKLEVNGNLSQQNMGKFRRTWEVVIGTDTTQKSALKIPENYLTKIKATEQSQAQASALQQIHVIQNSRSLALHSKAGRRMGSTLSNILFGAVFLVTGVFLLKQDWWPAYIFIVIGAITIFVSLFLAGHSIHTQIDKKTRIIKIRRSLFGIQFSNKTVGLFNPEQFKIEETSSSESGSRLTVYCAIYINDGNKKVKIAKGIEDKQAAQALLDKLLAELF